MITGSWYVFCSREKLAPLTDFSESFSKLRGASITELDREYAELSIHDALTGNDARVRVYVDEDAHVAAEARRLAAANPEIDARDALATADVRYAIVWDLVHSDETYNARAFIAEVLERATGGTIYDVTEGRFV